MPEERAKTDLGEFIINNSNGGTGAEINVSGVGAKGPVVGVEASGMQVIQTGPGTGLKLTVTGDGSSSVTGMRITKIIRGD